ncbi:WD40-repeat-containing domain protein [Chlamydoabsidia padenii]|nr:WD40-repeat-containing domain protein [Chlamydoabsidia padenii]
MIAKTLEINWHDGQAVYSVDFSSDGERFATAGADATVRLWSIKAKSYSTNQHASDDPSRQLPVTIDFLSELKRHSSPVNVVRFSPNGEYLASAGDDACVILWRISANRETTFGSEYSEYEKESWTATHMLYGHNKEIYDLAWSPCGQYLITASIDNTARIWSVSDRTAIHVFADHTHYVQGVAWDPLGQFVATQSSDRSMAIYKYRKGPDGKLLFGHCTKRHNYLDRGKIDKEMTTTKNNTTDTEETTGTYRLYHDENLVSFFRRLSFSPDGAFLVTPAGISKNTTSLPSTTQSDEDIQHCSYIFPRNTMIKYPIAFTGNHSKPSIAVRWCHQMYERRPSKHTPLFNLPYRIIYAVATQDSVYIYDTQQDKPLCAISGMHYAPITDLSWSKDGTILTFSSADGYCSAVVFTTDEFGVPTCKYNMTHIVQDDDMTEATDEVVETPVTTPSTTMLDQWAKTTPPVMLPPKSIKRRITPTLLSSSPFDKKPRITPP